MRDFDEANFILAFNQALTRVYSRLSPEICKSLLEAIGRRPDSLEKIHRFQAVEVLALDSYKALLEEYGQEVACVASYWATEAQIRSDQVWRRLHGNTPKPSIDEDIEGLVVAQFMDDSELMGLLGLQAGWTRDLKQIDPGLDTLS